MTDIPLPAPGDSSWSDWGQEQEDASDALRQLVVNVPDDATDMADQIADAIEAMRQADGKLHGVLRIEGDAPAYLASALVIDGGYADVTPGDANWGTETPRRFRIEGNLKPDTGLGAAVTIKGMYGATVRLGIHGGGLFTTTTGSITSGQATLTSAGAVSAGIKVGGVVQVDGAGKLFNGANTPLVASVRSIAGNVLTLSQAASATMSSAAVYAGDAALRVEDHVNLNIEHLDVKNFAGAGLVMDATDATAKRIRQSSFGVLSFNNVDWGVVGKKVEAFGSLGRIWFNARVLGVYLGECDDIGWEHIEGGVGALPNDSANYVWLDTCNSLNGGRIATGDRATDAQVLITGGDVGFIDRIRATGWSGFNSPSAIKLVDVISITIGHAYTRECVKGLHIVGGSGTATPRSMIRVVNHHSLTNDTNPLYIEPSATMTAPTIQVTANWRRPKRQGVVVATGYTGGLLKLDGWLDQVNTDGAASMYAIDCQSSAMQLDLAGFRQTERTTLVGALFHADPSKVYGVDRAWLEGNNLTTDAIAHGGAVTTITTPTSGADQRNTSPNPATYSVRVRLDPLVGADATATLYLGYWGIGGATQSIVEFAKVIRKAGSPVGDEHVFIFPVRAYGRWQVAVTNATIVDARKISYT